MAYPGEDPNTPCLGWHGQRRRGKAGLFAVTDSLGQRIIMQSGDCVSMLAGQVCRHARL